MVERVRFVRQPSHIDAHHLNEVAKLCHDRRFGDELASQVIKDIARLLRDVLQREIETCGSHCANDFVEKRVRPMYPPVYYRDYGNAV